MLHGIWRFVALSVVWISATALSATGATIVVPPVTITSLAESASYVAPPAESTSTSGVTFPSGPGTFTSSGFSASVGASDQIVVRFQAPANGRFNVLMPANATAIEFACIAHWDTGGGGGPQSSTSSVTWIGLQGPAPTRTVDSNYITNNGQRISVDNRFTVAAPFSFEAIEITFDPANNPMQMLRTYSSVRSDSAPSFYARARGVGLEVSPAMELFIEPPETITVPPVTITELAHQYSTGANNTASDTVTFPSGPGSHTSSGFSAAIEQNDEVVVRFQAPAGKAFMVRKWVAATSTVLSFSGSWLESPEAVTQVVNGTVTWEGLSNPPPTQIIGEDGVSNSGGVIRVRHEFQVTASFSFTAVEIRFPVTHATSGATYNFGPVLAAQSPSMGAVATGPTLSNVAVMDVVDLVPETIEIPPVQVQELAHFYLPEKFGPGSDDSIYDGVTANGFGVLNGPGFTASIGSGDELVARFEAPAGYRFRATVPSTGSVQSHWLYIVGVWRTFANDGVQGLGGAGLPSVSWIGLVGPAPTPAGNGFFQVSNGGNTVTISDILLVSSAFEFEAVEFRRNVPGISIANWTRTYQNFGPVDLNPPFVSAVFLSEVVGTGLADEALLELVPITPPSCPGDANGDNIVNSADLSVLLSQFGQSVPSGTGADFNDDGVVNSADLSVLLSSFGQGC